MLGAHPGKLRRPVEDPLFDRVARAELHLGEVRRFGGRPPDAADDLAEGPGQLGRIGRDAVVEADGPAVLPGVAEMEGEPGRELAPAPLPEIVLAHVEHPRAELRPPDMCVEETALGRETLPVEHQRRKDEHQVIGRNREVVDHAERCHGNLADAAGLPAASIR